jgi:hypothetical protein
MRDLIEDLKALTEARKKKPKKLSKKALERELERLYGKHGYGVQVPILDLGKIFKAGEQAYAGGGGIEAAEAALKAAIQKYRKN